MTELYKAVPFLLTITLAQLIPFSKSYAFSLGCEKMISLISEDLMLSADIAVRAVSEKDIRPSLGTPFSQPKEIVIFTERLKSEDKKKTHGFKGNERRFEAYADRIFDECSQISRVEFRDILTHSSIRFSMLDTIHMKRDVCVNSPAIPPAWGQQYCP